MEQCREFIVDGERIAASLHVPDATPAPGVVMCHGFTGHRIEAHFLFVKAARELCAAGLNVLRLDFRGSGESEGRFRDMTIEGEIADALAALEAARAEPTVDPARVALLGLSLGGLVAACATSRDSGVQALVLWSAVGDFAELMRERFDMPTDLGRVGLRGYYERGAFEIGSGFVADALTISPLREVRDYAGPVLVVHGTDDQAVPLEHADKYLNALTHADATQHVVQGGDHTFSTPDFEREVIAVTRDWLVEHLMGGRAP